MSVSKKVEKEGSAEIVSLDGTDLYLLRWLINSQSSLPHVKINGQDFFTVKYEKIADAMPILHLQKQAIAKRMKKYCTLELLESATIDLGSALWFSMTPKLFSLLPKDVAELKPQPNM